MYWRNASGRWQLCPGCGRERRLAAGSAVICDHNRWDSIAWSMVPCEGSSQAPRSHGSGSAAAACVPAPRGALATDGDRAA
jgi:hypothetical protein